VPRVPPHALLATPEVVPKLPAERMPRGRALLVAHTAPNRGATRILADGVILALLAVLTTA